VELLDPFHHDLDIPQIAETPKQTPAFLLHGFPIGVGIERHQSVSQGAAAAQGNAQVVNRVRAEIGGNMGTFFEDLKHPVAQARNFLGAGWAIGESWH
jgi:hypothetical protein